MADFNHLMKASRGGMGSGSSAANGNNRHGAPTEMGAFPGRATPFGGSSMMLPGQDRSESPTHRIPGKMTRAERKAESKAVKDAVKEAKQREKERKSEEKRAAKEQKRANKDEAWVQQQNTAQPESNNRWSTHSDVLVGSAEDIIQESNNEVQASAGLPVHEEEVDAFAEDVSTEPTGSAEPDAPPPPQPEPEPEPEPVKIRKKLKGGILPDGVPVPDLIKRSVIGDGKSPDHRPWVHEGRRLSQVSVYSGFGIEDEEEETGFGDIIDENDNNEANRKNSNFSGFGDEASPDPGSANPTNAPVPEALEPEPEPEPEPEVDPTTKLFMSVGASSGDITIDQFINLVQNEGLTATLSEIIQITTNVFDDKMDLASFTSMLPQVREASAAHITAKFDAKWDSGEQISAGQVQTNVLAPMGCDLSSEARQQVVAEFNSATNALLEEYSRDQVVDLAERAFRLQRSRLYNAFNEADKDRQGELLPFQALPLLRNSGRSVDDEEFVDLLASKGYATDKKLGFTAFIMMYEDLLKVLHVRALEQAAMVPVAPSAGAQTSSSTTRDTRERGSSVNQLLAIKAIPKKQVATARHQNMARMTSIRHKVNEQARGPAAGERTLIPHDDINLVRDNKNKKKVWDVRRINEQVRSPQVGQKTAVTVDSKFLQNEMKAQRVASVRVNRQITGSVKRDGADISYYSSDADRFLRPAAILDFDTSSEGSGQAIPMEVALNEKEMSPFFHPFLTNKKDTERYMRQMAAKKPLRKGATHNGTFLLRPERHGTSDKPCISVFVKNRITNHVLTSRGPGSVFSVSCFPFATKNEVLVGCTTIPQCIERLKKATRFYKAPLLNGIRPSQQDIDSYREDKLREEQTKAFEAAANHVPTEDAYGNPIAAPAEPEEKDLMSKVGRHSTPFEVANKPKVINEKKKASRFTKRRASLKEMHNEPALVATTASKKSNKPSTRKLLSDAAPPKSGGWFRRKPAPAPAPEPEPEPEADAAAADVGGEFDDAVMSPFYHGDLDKPTAEALLFGNGGSLVAGKFLLRKSDLLAEQAEVYLLSVVYKEQATHHKIAREASGFMSINEKSTELVVTPLNPASNLAELVQLLRQKNRELAWPVPLTEGVTRVVDESAVDVVESQLEAAMNSEEGKIELKALFDSLDKDSDGHVTGKEWGQAVATKREVMGKYFGGASLKEIGQAFKRIDVDDSGTLTWDEFLGSTTFTEESVEKVNEGLAAAMSTDEGESELKALFETLDKDQDGQISGKEWGRSLSANQELMAKFFGGATKAEVGKAFRRIDVDGNGSLTWDEFKANVQRGPSAEDSKPPPPQDPTQAKADQAKADQAKADQAAKAAEEDKIAQAKQQEAAEPSQFVRRPSIFKDKSAFTEEPKPMKSVLMRRSSVGHKQMIDVKKVYSNVTNTAGLVPTLGVGAEAIRRGRASQTKAFVAKRVFSNILSGAAKSNLSMDSEILARESKAQVVASRKVNVQITGKVERGGADISFFEKKATTDDIIGAGSDDRVNNIRQNMTKKPGYEINRAPVEMPRATLEQRLASLIPQEPDAPAAEGKKKRSWLSFRKPKQKAVEKSDYVAVDTTLHSEKKQQDPIVEEAPVAPFEEDPYATGEVMDAATGDGAVTVDIVEMLERVLSDASVYVDWLGDNCTADFTSTIGGITLTKDEYVSSVAACQAACPDMNFNLADIERIDGFTVAATATVTGTHTGVPFSPAPGLEPIAATDPAKTVTNDSERLLATFAADGKLAKLNVEVLPGGNGFSGPPGWYAQLGEGPAASEAQPPTEEAEDPANKRFIGLHMELDKDGAAELLLADGGRQVPGKYLFRYMEELPENVVEPTACILSVVYRLKATHHPVTQDTDGMYMLSGRRTPCSTLDSLSKHLAQRRGELKWPVPLVKVVVDPDHPQLIKAAQDEAAKLATEDASRAAKLAAMPEAAKFPYLHESLSQGDANMLLTENNGLSISGKYLIRSVAKEDPADAETFIVSVVYKKKPTHHVIARLDNGNLSITDRPTQCGTLFELAEFLGKKQASIKWPVPLTEGLEPSSVAPPPLAAPVDESTASAAPIEPYMWVPGDSVAATEAVKSAADTGDFLVRESNGNYVLVVKDFGKVQNIKLDESSSGGFKIDGNEYPTVQALVESLKAGSSNPLKSTDLGHTGEAIFLNNGIPSQ